MSQQSTKVLERLLRDNNLEWVLDIFGPSERFLPNWIKQLDEATAEYQARFGVSMSFTPEALEAEAIKSPHKIRAFLQAICVASALSKLNFGVRSAAFRRNSRLKPVLRTPKFSLDDALVLQPCWSWFGESSKGIRFEKST